MRPGYAVTDCSLVANRDNILTTVPGSIHTTPPSESLGRLNPWLPEEVTWSEWSPLICPLPVCFALIMLHPLRGHTQHHPGSFFNWAIFAAVERVTPTTIFARLRLKTYVDPVRDPQKVRTLEDMCAESRRLEREQDVPFGLEGSGPAAIRLVAATTEVPITQTWVLD